MRPASAIASRLLAFALAIAPLAACANGEPVNSALTHDGGNLEPHAFDQGTNTDRPFIVMAISGGGTRAAALGYSVFEELGRYTYADGAASRPLVRDVRAISSVSGGSVAAAYFVMKYPDPIDDMHDRFLVKDNMAALEWEAANPITWLGLAFSNFTRIEALQDLFTAELFRDANGKAVTFGDINRSDKPLLILNSTDMGTGEVFPFTPAQFDNLCSDLGPLPLSAGVAASADFPIALSPMTIANYSSRCKAALKPPMWITQALKPALLSRYFDLEEFKRARYAASLRHLDAAGNPTEPKSSPYPDIEYIHLLDGGVADNVGVQSLTTLIGRNYGAGRLFNAIQTGSVKKVVVLTVNARSDPPNGLNASSNVPGTIAALNVVTSVPIDAATAANNASLNEVVAQLSLQRLEAPPGALVRDLEIYNIAIDFDQIPDAPAGLRDRVKKIPTLWTITADQLTDIDDAAKLMVRQNPCFLRLIQDLGVVSPYVDSHDSAAKACITRPTKN
jgi:NTE family protein